MREHPNNHSLDEPGFKHMNSLRNFLHDLIRPLGEAREFEKSFPVVSWMIMRPQLTVLAAICAALSLRSISPVFALAPLCISTAFVAFFLERRLIDRMLFPPFTAVTCWAALGTGVGIPIMDWQIHNALRMSIYGVTDWHPALLMIQTAYLVSFPLTWIGYYYGGFRKVPQLTGDSLFESNSPAMRDKIDMLGWALLLISVGMVIIRVSAGLEERGRSGISPHEPGALQTCVRLLFAVAPKWGMLGFVFVPRLWGKGGAGRIFVAILLIAYFCVALATGSRGYLLYPCCFMLAGYYFFRPSSTWKTELLLSSLAAVGFVVVFAIYIYRQSDQYTSSSASDLSSRYRAFRDSVIRLDPSKWRPETVFDFGYSFYGLEDAKVYALTPNPIRHAGFSGFEAMPLTWIPTTFVKNKPRLLDAEFIVGSYDSPPGQVVGTSISLTADTYRRFGWLAVPVTLLIAFGIYGVIIRWMLTWWRRGTLWGWGLLFFSMTFFWSRPFSTVLETWWAFFYDMPKQLLATAALCFLVSKAADLVSSRKDASGNDSLSGRR